MIFYCHLMSADCAELMLKCTSQEHVHKNTSNFSFFLLEPTLVVSRPDASASNCNAAAKRGVLDAFCGKHLLLFLSVNTLSLL